MIRRARIFLVDDSPDILDLYERMINKQEDMECVGTRESTVGLEAAVEENQADVAVIDLIGPARDAMEAIRATAVACPQCRLIAFSGYDDSITRDRAVQAGAWSLMSKDDPPMTLLEEIRRALQQR